MRRHVRTQNVLAESADSGAGQNQVWILPCLFLLFVLELFEEKVFNVPFFKGIQRSGHKDL